MQVIDSTGLDSSWCRVAYLVCPDDASEDDLLNQASLAVEYKSGTICWYPSTDKSDYDGLISAGSPGQYVHANLYALSYQIIVL